MRRTSVILNSAHQKAKMWLLVHRNKVVLLAAAAAGTCYVVKVRRKSILTTRGATIAVLACWVWACIDQQQHASIWYSAHSATCTGVFVGGRYLVRKLSEQQDGQQSAQLRSLR